MNLLAFLKCLLIEIIFICLANGVTMIVKQETEGMFCFTLQNSTLNETSEPPKVSVDLLVKYPQSIAEAGYVDLENELTPGPHKIWYKYLITNMTHGLKVELDGQNIEFIKPKIPRWYTVSRFHEVAFAFQGGIVEYNCPFNKSKISDDILTFPTGLNVFTSSTKRSFNEEKIMKTTTTSPSSSPSPSPSVTTSKTDFLENKSKGNVSRHEILHPQNHSDHVNKIGNESFSKITTKETNKLPLTTVSTLVNKTVEKEQASKQQTNQINISIEIPNATLDRQGNLLPPIFLDRNYSDFENSRPESSQSCLNGECEGQYSRDFTVAVCLISILVALVLIAIVISVVFHRKKKKLMISNRARPNNRLRQQIFEKEIAGESLLMLRQMEHTYEEIP